MSNLTAVIWHFRTTKIPTQGTKLITFSIEGSYTTKNMSIEGLMLEGRNLVCSNGEL